MLVVANTSLFYAFNAIEIALGLGRQQCLSGPSSTQEMGPVTGIAYVSADIARQITLPSFSHVLLSMSWTQSKEIFAEVYSWDQPSPRIISSSLV